MSFGRTLTEINIQINYVFLSGSTLNTVLTVGGGLVAGILRKGASKPKRVRRVGTVGVCVCVCVIYTPHGLFIVGPVAGNMSSRIKCHTISAKIQ